MKKKVRNGAKSVFHIVVRNGRASLHKGTNVTWHENLPVLPRCQRVQKVK